MHQPLGPNDQTVIHRTIPADPRCKVVLKQMAKGVQWEVDMSHEDPQEALRIVETIHDQLVAKFGQQGYSE